MDPHTFSESASPPNGSPAVQALWHEGQGDWKRAHALVQDDPGRDAARVHAYLHRKEGDLDNARYWYARTGHSVFDGTSDQEWQALVEELA